MQGQIAHAPMQLDEDAPAQNHAGEEEAVPVRRALAPRPLRLAQRTAVAVPMQDRPNGVNRPRENRADDGVLPVHGQADAGAPLLHDRADERRLPNERVITPANSEEAVQLVATIQDVRPATVVQLRRISDVFKAVARFRLRGREGMVVAHRCGHDIHILLLQAANASRETMTPALEMQLLRTGKVALTTVLAPRRVQVPTMAQVRLML